MEPIKVRILDHEYLIKSDGDVELIHQIADYVNEKLKEVKEDTERLSEKRTAILAALNIASDYFQLLKEREELITHIRERTNAIIDDIDTVID
ncbi:MAG: cell division protein ZapA [Pseudomonadota bacterium]